MSAVSGNNIPGGGDGGNPHKRKRGDEKAGSTSSAPTNPIGERINYFIEWKSRTFGNDPHMGGEDFCRLRVTGTLFWRPNDENWDVVQEVGKIVAVKFNSHYIGNNGVNQFDVYDETQEWHDMYVNVIQPREEDFDEDLSGNLLYIQTHEIRPAHRGHGLGRWLLEAADAVQNAQMSICVLKPFPLQFEAAELHSWPNYGFPAPPAAGTAARQAALDAAKARLVNYYSQLGFHQHNQGPFFTRWNG